MQVFLTVINCLRILMLFFCRKLIFNISFFNPRCSLCRGFFLGVSISLTDN